MIATGDLRLGNWVYESECTRYPMYVHTIGEDYVYLNFDGNEGMSLNASLRSCKAFR